MKYNITKQYLEKQLTTKSVLDIAIDIGCSTSLIYMKIKKYCIEMPQLSLIGYKFNDFEVIGKGSSGQGSQFWLCKCICGTEKELPTSVVNKGNIKTCGCWFRRNNKEKNHNFTGYKEIHGKYWSTIKRNAIKHGKDFTINIKYAWRLFENQGRKCALSGLPISFPDIVRENRTASLDRVDSNKGYIPGNVQWVHKDINWMKQDFDQTYFLDMCDMVFRNRIRE